MERACTVKKEYVLDGLGCANCAAKIEREVGKLDGVSSASVDFISKTLTMEIEKPLEIENVISKTQKIVNSHEPDVVIREKESAAVQEKAVLLKGLGCANCARKIEDAVSRIDGVCSAEINFASQSLTITASEPSQFPEIFQQTERIAVSIEPDIVLSYPEQTEKYSRVSAKQRIRYGFLGAGALLFAAAMIFPLHPLIKLPLFILSYLLIGGEILLRALRNILKGQLFDENFLMGVATIGAFAVGQYPEGVAVMLFYQIGEFFQELAVNRSRKSISSLMDIRPDYANLKVGGEIRKVSPEKVNIGDCIVVKSGEKIPLDGKVLSGKASLDTSALTGESLPRDVGEGSEVLSGSINKDGMLMVEVTKTYGESTASKILDLVQNAGSKKAPTENFITKFARYYTPCVVFAALALALLPPLLISGFTFTESIHRALVFLVVSCPCALVISIPLSYFGGIGGASKNGILIKGSNYLDVLNQTDTVVFDKTGTLTKGVFKVTKIAAANGYSDDQLLLYAAHAESFSNHPISLSIRQAYERPVDTQIVSDQEELPGFGLKAKVNGIPVYAGNSRLMEQQRIVYQKAAEIGTAVYLAIDGKFAGYLVISDEIKPDSAQAMKGLKAAGIKRTVMLTGDNKAVAEKAAKEIGVDTVYSELLPDQKVEKLEELYRGKSAKGKTAFVGDGINDAPVLARADVGIAMGGLGSDAAIEAADVVLMTDEPSKLITAVRVAKKTHQIVWQNILFALGVKAVILVLGAFGAATMWEAVFGDVGVTVIAVLNSMRAMGGYNPKQSL